MKKVLTLTAALMVIGASASLASGLIAMWNDCSAGGGVSDKTFACTSNLGAASLYLSAVVPNEIPGFLGSTAIVDVTVDGATLPDWWLTASGQCRQNAISMTFDPVNILPPSFACADIWQQFSNLQVFTVQQATGHGPNQLRLNGGAAIPAPTTIDVVADGSELMIAKVTITYAKSSGTGLCDGCLTPACIVFNEAYMQQYSPAPSFRVTNAESANSNFVTWQTNPTNCPVSTPALNRTWGAVKNLYR